MASGQQSYLLVGAGMFGASTALHLKKTMPNCTVTLIERGEVPCRSAASHDLNKIVRADYEDTFHMKLAVEAMEGWYSSEVFNPFYHESGILIADSTGWGPKCLANYQSLNIKHEAEILSCETAVQRFPMFRHADWSGTDSCYWNPKSGWVEADKALASCLHAAKAAGVEILTALVSQVFTDDKGQCMGVITSNNDIIRADNVVLCTGAYTDKLLLDSFPESDALHVNGRVVAAGALEYSVTYDKGEESKMKDVPVLINTLPHTNGDAVPPLQDGRMKFNCQLSFTNMTRHTKTGKTISIPPNVESQSTWGQDVPQQLRDEAVSIMQQTYGKYLQGLKIQELRMCWDAVTPDQNWIISPHPGVPHLFVVTGGSFHGWKFMPIIGKYVVQMLRGELDEEATQLWAWDRSHEGAACAAYIPSRDLADLY